MLDLVPFAPPRREMANAQLDPDVVGQILQGHLPVTIARPVAAAAICCNRQFLRTRKQDRLELIEQILDSLPEHVSPDEVPEWHLAELAKRRSEADVSPRVGKPWREALARFGSGS